MKRFDLECPKCGRIEKDFAPETGYEPPGTVLIQVLCEECSHGTKDAGENYFDTDGNQLFMGDNF